MPSPSTKVTALDSPELRERAVRLLDLLDRPSDHPAYALDLREAKERLRAALAWVPVNVAVKGARRHGAR